MSDTMTAIQISKQAVSEHIDTRTAILERRESVMIEREKDVERREQNLDLWLGRCNYQGVADQQKLKNFQTVIQNLLTQVTELTVERENLVQTMASACTDSNSRFQSHQHDYIQGVYPRQPDVNRQQQQKPRVVTPFPAGSLGHQAQPDISEAKDKTALNGPKNAEDCQDVNARGDAPFASEEVERNAAIAQTSLQEQIDSIDNNSFLQQLL